MVLIGISTLPLGPDMVVILARAVAEVCVDEVQVQREGIAAHFAGEHDPEVEAAEIAAGTDAGADVNRLTRIRRHNGRHVEVQRPVDIRRPQVWNGREVPLAV